MPGLDASMTKALRILAQIAGTDGPAGGLAQGPSMSAAGLPGTALPVFRGHVSEAGLPKSWWSVAQQMLQRFGTNAAPTVMEVETLLGQVPKRLSNLELDAMNKLKGRLRLMPPRGE